MYLFWNLMLLKWTRSNMNDTKIESNPESTTSRWCSQSKVDLIKEFVCIVTVWGRRRELGCAVKCETPPFIPGNNDEKLGISGLEVT